MTNDFLTAFHDSFEAPRDRCITLIERVMNANATSLKRITQGSVNKVYRAEFTLAPTVFVRIRRRGGVVFDSEAWALEACRHVGVPVPKVYAVTPLEAEEPLKVMISKAESKRDSRLPCQMPLLY